MFEYVKVTRSSNDTLDCTGLMSQKTYKNVEIINNVGVDSVPPVDSIGILMIVQNAEYVWIGQLNQVLSQLLPGNLRVHAGSANGILFEDGTTIIYNGTATKEGKFPEEYYDYVHTQVIKLDDDGTIQIAKKDNSGNIISEVLLAANGDVNITGTVINLN